MQVTAQTEDNRSAGAWRPSARVSAPRYTASGFRLPDRSIVALLIFTIILRTSQMHHLLGGAAFQITLGIELAIYAYYAVISARSWNYGALAIIALFVGSLLFQAWNFSARSGAAFNVNTVFQYTSILAVFVFYETRCSTEFIQRVIVYIVLGYLLIYNLFYDQLLAMAPSDSALFRPGSAGRSARLYLADPLATFALLVGFFSLRRAPIFSLALIGLAAVAIIGAQSRAFTVALVFGLCAVWFAVLFPPLRRLVYWVLAAIFLALSLYLIAPMAGFDYNPYAPLVADVSGKARYLQFQDAMRVLKDSALLGIGIAPSLTDLQEFVNPVRPFFASDLGIFGISFTFGLPFAIAYILLSVGLITTPPLNEHGRRMMPLFYTVQIQAVLGFFSAGILNTATSLFAAIVIACWIKYPARRATPREPKYPYRAQDPGVEAQA